MLIGLLSGAVAAILAALLSLPLHSPDDALFNTATVTIGALVAGVIAGGLRRALTQRSFAIAWGAAFVTVVAGLAAGESTFQRMLAFGLPTAAVVFGVTGLGVSFLRDRALPKVSAITATAVGLAVAIGLGLSGEGDAASGSLSLPATAPAAAPATAVATAAANAPGTAGAVPTASASAPSTRGVDGLPARFATQADLKNVTFVVGEGSQATFTANEKLAQFPLPNEAVMRSTALTGDIRLDGRPSKITLDLLRLSSDQPRRDMFIRQGFRAHPVAVLTVPSISALPDRYETGQTVKQTVRGTLAINGVERPITFEIEARMDGAVLSVLGKTSFLWKDFDLPPPNTPTVQVQDRVAVEVLIASRPQVG